MPPSKRKPALKSVPPPAEEAVTRPTPARKRTGREKGTTAEDKGAQAARARAGRAKAHAAREAERARLLEEDADYAIVDTREQAIANAKAEVTLKLTGKMAQLYLGLRSVEDMDDEELAAMQWKDRNGHFTGGKPKNLPAELVNAMRRELMDRATTMFNGSLLKSVEALRDIATNDDAEDKDRIRAANLLIERVMGKTPDKVELSAGTKPFEVVFTSITRGAPPPSETE